MHWLICVRTLNAIHPAFLASGCLWLIAVRIADDDVSNAFAVAFGDAPVGKHRFAFVHLELRLRTPDVATGKTQVMGGMGGMNEPEVSADCLVEINGGTLNITMGQGDTDAIDSNGYIKINGGTITISAQSPFDYELGGELNGGTVTVNGQQVTQITGSMMGGGGMGGQQPGAMGGQQPGSMGGSRGMRP